MPPNNLKPFPKLAPLTDHEKVGMLLGAALLVLQTHGLPMSCEEMEKPWHFAGNEEQQRSLKHLLATIDHLLPKLPSQKGGQ